jgi:hypothetical protein
MRRGKVCAAARTTVALSQTFARAAFRSAGGSVVSASAQVSLLIAPSFDNTTLHIVSTGPPGLAVNGNVPAAADPPLLLAYGASVTADFVAVTGSAPLAFSWLRDGTQVSTTRQLAIASTTVRRRGLTGVAPTVVRTCVRRAQTRAPISLPWPMLAAPRFLRHSV